MKVIGIVGGMGAGKSSVVELIKENSKAYVINADHIGHDVLKKDQIGYIPTVERFGTEILGEDGEINREILGSIIFSDPIKRETLNKISHPLIYNRVKKEIMKITQQGSYDYIVVDAALLIEIRLIELVDEVWGVYAPLDAQIQRVMLRNDFSKGEATQRVLSQLPWEETKKVTHVIIDNTGDMSYAKEQVLSLLG